MISLGPGSRLVLAGSIAVWAIMVAPRAHAQASPAVAKTYRRPTQKVTHPAAKISADPLQRARELGAASRWPEAEQALRLALAAHPDDVEAAALHAEALIKIGQPFDAALQVETYLKAHPDALRMHQLYAVLAASTLRDPTLAGVELETCVRLAPNSFTSWLSLGDLNMDQAKQDAAVKAYRRAVQLGPGNAVAAASLGHAYAAQNDSAHATEEFQRARALSHRSGGSSLESATVEYLYGVFLAEQGEGEEAITALTMALQFNPKSSDTFYWRARAFQSLQQNAKAIADADEAIRLSPGSKEAPLLLITLYRKAGDLANAQKYADRTQQITDAEQQQASFGRGLRDTLDKAEPLLREARYGDAIPLYESLLQKVPRFYEAWFALGTCYSETGRFAEARTALQKYLSFQPVSADGHAALGIVLAQSNDLDAATGELQRAMDLDANNTEVRKVLAQVLLQRKQPGRAAAVLQTAAAGGDAETQALLAEALAQSGQTGPALQAAERALALDPQNAQAATVRSSLQSPRSPRQQR